MHLHCNPRLAGLEASAAPGVLAPDQGALVVVCGRCAAGPERASRWRRERVQSVPACRQTLKVPETARALVEGNFTYFFDIDSDGVDAQWLRTIILFAEQPGDKTYEDRMVDGATPSARAHARPGLRRCSLILLIALLPGSTAPPRLPPCFRPEAVPRHAPPG